LITRFKIIPVQGLEKHQEIVTSLDEKVSKLEKLEQTEGIQSFELNLEKIIVSRETMELNIELHSLVRKMEVAPNGERRCLVWDSKLFNSFQEEFNMVKNLYPTLSWKPIEDFFYTTLKQKFQKIAAEDETFLKSTILETSADVFESIGYHLAKICTQFIFLGKKNKEIARHARGRKKTS